MIMYLLDWLFPQRCVNCQTIGQYICPDCLNLVSLNHQTICPACTQLSPFGLTHARCRTPQAMDGLIAACKYQGVIKTMITKYKYRWIEDLTQVLIELLITHGDLEPALKVKRVIVPVPLHPNRLRWRGFNQSALLGQTLATYLHFPYQDQALVRFKQTPPQMSLTKTQRKINVKDAFTLKHRHLVNHQHLLLLDDVWTTGATMRECTKVLKRAGAKSVWGVVLAKG
jgi:competence protein ComFC